MYHSTFTYFVEERLNSRDPSKKFNIHRVEAPNKVTPREEIMELHSFWTYISLFLFFRYVYRYATSCKPIIERETESESEY